MSQSSFRNAQSPMQSKQGPQVKLVKVLVQPMFVLDHGDHLTEVDHPAVAIPAEEWPTYSSERFPREVAEWQRHLDTSC